jgi:DNA repair protein RadC
LWNHFGAHSPLGNLAASQSDIELTKKLSEGGRILEITVLDHVILTSSDNPTM